MHIHSRDAVKNLTHKIFLPSSPTCSIYMCICFGKMFECSPGSVSGSDWLIAANLYKQYCCSCTAQQQQEGGGVKRPEYLKLTLHYCKVKWEGWPGNGKCCFQWQSTKERDEYRTYNDVKREDEILKHIYSSWMFYDVLLLDLCIRN